jgi:uncharacterized radical SAM superfamily Fe-S cluster-containing enzyme
MSKLLTIPIRIESAPAKDSYLARLEKLSIALRAMDADAVAAHFALDETATLLKTTISLCAECLTHVAAAVYERNSAVWITKICATHGQQIAIIENDVNYYSLSNKDSCGRTYASTQSIDIPPFTENSCCGAGESCTPSKDSVWPYDFADQRSNKSCTVLVEITNACNLSCRVCYAESGHGNDRILPLAQFKETISGLLAQKGGLDSVQVTGGEASLHPDFWHILHWLAEQSGIKMIYVPSNGIEFNKPDIAERLVPIKHKVLVLLQFDGIDQPTNQTLRAVSPEAMRLRLIARLNRLQIPMQLTMTLTPDLSEADIAWVVQQGKRYANVRLVALQPAFTSGRYELDFNPVHRLTLSDCIKGVAAGLDGDLNTADFFPIPCSHPNCGWVTLFVRRYGFFANIARYIDLPAVMDKVAYKTQLGGEDMQSIVGTRKNGLLNFIARFARRLVRPQDVFGIAIKPFMDRYNYDQDRVNNCCHHITNTDGQLLSFCEYNARFRATDSWQRFPKLAK